MGSDHENTPDLKMRLSWGWGIPRGISLRRRHHFLRGISSESPIISKRLKYSTRKSHTMSRLSTPPFRGVVLMIIFFSFVGFFGIITGIQNGFSPQIITTLIVWLILTIVIWIIPSCIFTVPIIDLRSAIYIWLLIGGLFASLFAIRAWGWQGTHIHFFMIYWYIVIFYFFSISIFANKKLPLLKQINYLHDRIPHQDTHPFKNYTEWIRRHLPQLPSKKLHVNVENAINSFKPSRNWEYERQYQDELFSWLKRDFPNIVEYEVTKGSSRPDLVIKDIAIEIKGPTGNRELDTLTTKFLKYANYYPHFIIVLFDCHFSEGHFDEIQSGIKKVAPHVIIIRK